MSVEAMLAGLQDIRLPSTAPGGVLADLVAAFALACLLALIVGAVIRLVSRPRSDRAAPGLGDRLDALADLPEDARRVALLHLLKSHAPERFAALKAGLYRPGLAPDTAQIESELRRHV